MSSFRISRSDRALLGVLVPLVVLSAFLVHRVLPHERAGSPLEQPSTLFTASYGTKAAFTTLERLGVPVARVRRAPDRALLDGVRTLFVLGPVRPLGKQTETTLLDWVSRGHVLVIAPSAFEPFKAFLDRSAVAGSETGKNQVLDAGEPLSEGIHRLSMQGLEAVLGGPAIGPLEHAETSRFWTDSRGTLGMTLRHGSGEIVALADAFPLENAGLLEADDATLLANLARLRSSPDDGGKVVFDEYHLGFDDRDTSPVAMVKLVLGGRARGATLQALAVLALALFGAAVRFGAPTKRVPPPRRAQGEFVDAAARLLLGARAARHVEEKLLDDFRLSARRLLHLSESASDADIEEELAARAGPGARALFAKARGGESATATGVLVTAQALHRALQAVQSGQ